MNLNVALWTGPVVPLRTAERRRLRGADLLVLPELFDGGYRALRAGGSPVTAHTPHVRFLRELSSTERLTCVAGSAMLRRRGATTNTTLVFARGRTVASYDKIHLFRPAGDHRFFVRGTRPVTFLLRAGRRRIRVGLMLCFDLRFPELARELVRRGSEILVVPARWPRMRNEAWKTLLRARAIENQVFVIGCNAAGREGGPSYVFGPDGRMLLAMVSRKAGGLKRCSCDLADIGRVRRLFDARREAVLLRR